MILVVQGQALIGIYLLKRFLSLVNIWLWCRYVGDKKLIIIFRWVVMERVWLSLKLWIIFLRMYQMYFQIAFIIILKTKIITKSKTQKLKYKNMKKASLDTLLY